MVWEIKRARRGVIYRERRIRIVWGKKKRGNREIREGRKMLKKKGWGEKGKLE